MTELSLCLGEHCAIKPAWISRATNCSVNDLLNTSKQLENTIFNMFSTTAQVI